MIHTLTLTGAAAVVQLKTASTAAQWIEIWNGASSNAINVGDGSTSSSVGRPVPHTTAFLLPPVHRGGYDLNQVYVYIAMSDVVTVTYEDFD